MRTWRLERIRQLCAQHGSPAPVAVQQQHSYLCPKPGAASTSIVDDEQLDHLRAHDDLTLVAPPLPALHVTLSDHPLRRLDHAGA